MRFAARRAAISLMRPSVIVSVSGLKLKPLLFDPICTHRAAISFMGPSVIVCASGLKLKQLLFLFVICRNAAYNNLA